MNFKDRTMKIKIKLIKNIGNFVKKVILSFYKKIMKQ